jgi:preprotein translocase subunit SecD
MLQDFFEKILNPGSRGKVWRLLILIIALVIFGSMIVGGSYYNKGSQWISAKTGESINLPKVKEFPFKLGLDLSGGTQLTYQANMSNIPSADRAAAAEGARDVIERRVNVFGVSEPVVQTSVSGGEYKIIVELAGINDVKDAIKMIGETPLLEFKEQADKNRVLTAEEKKQITDDNKAVAKKATDVLGKLLSGGDFTALAKQYSDEQGAKDSGGDLGWITESTNPDVIDKVKSFKNGDFTRDLVEDASSYQLLKLVDKRIKTNPFNNKESEKEIRAYIC